MKLSDFVKMTRSPLRVHVGCVEMEEKQELATNQFQHLDQLGSLAAFSCVLTCPHAVKPPMYAFSKLSLPATLTDLRIRICTPETMTTKSKPMHFSPDSFLKNLQALTRLTTLKVTGDHVPHHRFVCDWSLLQHSRQLTSLQIGYGLDVTLKHLTPAIYDMPRLQFVDLFGGRWTHGDLLEFARTTHKHQMQIKWISLYNTLVPDHDAQWLSICEHLPYLESLMLAPCDIHTALTHALALPQLTRLSVQCPQFGLAPTGPFLKSCTFPRVKTLCLLYVNMYALDLEDQEWIPNTFPNLEALHIFGCEFPRHGETMRLPPLRHLSICTETSWFSSHSFSFWTKEMFPQLKLDTFAHTLNNNLWKRCVETFQADTQLS
jgi:hypothetical protein